jgi:integrase
MGLGDVDLVTLAEAREAARDARRLIAQGIDPIDDRRRRRLAGAASVTFEGAADAVIRARQAMWSAESLRQWQVSMKRHAFPVLGAMQCSAVDTAAVLRVLKPMWPKTQVSADRLRQRIEAILDWAGAHGYRSGDNPARWRGHLQHLLADEAKPVEHLAAMPYEQVPQFMRSLRARDGMAAKALEFTILTAVRTGETLGAKWDEIVGDVWTIPAERMKSRRTKARRPHSVPLSSLALETLEDLPRDGDFVFPGNRARKGLERHAMRELLEAMDISVTVHGFRSSFRDWAAEMTNYPGEVAEQALAHAISDKVERAYRRGDLFEKRRRLMDAWGQFCATVKDTGKVVPIGMR